jgi:hypothetical protein
MMTIPLPAGLEIPEGEPVDISATVQMMDGELMLVALEGIPVGDDMEEEDMEEEDMGEEAPEDFMSAVERNLQ